MLIGDENPCREPERWRKVLARRLKLPYWTVDADVVVPSAVFGRDYFLLQHMRPHLKKALPKFLVAAQSPKPQHAWHQAESPSTANHSPTTSPQASKTSIAPSNPSIPSPAEPTPPSGDLRTSSTTDSKTTRTNATIPK